MNVITYSRWRDTALTLHLVLQMLGKVKLARMEPQPEWNHVLLYLTPQGFTTGLVPNGDRSFCLSALIREGQIVAHDIAGRSSSFKFTDGQSVSQYYVEFQRILEEVMCETEIYTTPQEMNHITPFEEDHQPRNYNPQFALDFFNMCVFAHNAELKFVSAFRGKKILPQFFWGTFDVSAAVFSGKSYPFAGKGVIEKGAFDEQMIEFGFWPGDDNWPDPSFFILPYPFISENLADAGIQPVKAFWSNEKAEFFFKFKDIFSNANPEKAVLTFMQTGYDIITRQTNWDNLAWLNRPLEIKKGSFALYRDRPKH